MPDLFPDTPHNNVPLSVPSRPHAIRYWPSQTLDQANLAVQNLEQLGRDIGGGPKEIERYRYLARTWHGNGFYVSGSIEESEVKHQTLFLINNQVLAITQPQDGTEEARVEFLGASLAEEMKCGLCRIHHRAIRIVCGLNSVFPSYASFIERDYGSFGLRKGVKIPIGEGNELGARDSAGARRDLL